MMGELPVLAEGLLSLSVLVGRLHIGQTVKTVETAGTGRTVETVNFPS